MEKLWIFGAMAVAASFGSASVATAQTGAVAPPEDAAAGSGLADIVVTARRTNENLQRTPIAVTAFTTEAIAQKQIADVSSLQTTTPGLVVTTNHSGIGISLRGQVQTSADSSVDQSVGLYVDGVYIARQMGGRFDLVDIERVEVLHGPQGTLFGRNTTGGAVNIITNKPTNQFEGSIMLGAGNYDRREATGVVNMPLADGVSARFVGRHMEHGGYGRNVFLKRDVGDDNYDHFRASLQIAPSDEWSLIISGEYVDRDTNGPMVRPTTFAPTVPASQYTVLPFYDSASEQQAFEKIRMFNSTATLSVKVGDVTLKSISSYRDLKVHTLSDFDTIPTPLFFSEATSNISQVSQEVQALGTTDSIDWIVGGFYFHERGPERYDIFGGFLSYDSRISHKSLAPYGQVTVRLSDALRVTGGLRYTKDTRELIAHNTLGGGCFIASSELDDVAGCVARKDISDTYFSYSANVDYQAAESLFLYARTGMAHKSGGFNKTNNGLEPFAPEKVVDYEVGFKASLLDRRLRINVAAFTSDYSNMQRPITSDTTGVPIALIQSVGKARIRGAELEVTALPINGLEIAGTVGILDPKYVDFRDASGDRSGEPFTRVSKLTWSLSGTYSHEFSAGTLRAHADYGHQSQKYFFASPLTREPGFGVLNARLSFELKEPGVELALWGRNLTKTKYLVENLDFIAAASVNPGFPADPRTFGATVTYRFGN